MNSYILKKIFYIIAIFIIFIFSWKCRRDSGQVEKILAKVDDQKISLSEFQLFYELDPNFGIDSTGFPALLDELHKLINHKIAYIKGESDSLLSDSTFSLLIEWEKSRIMLRALYREVVEKDIEITEDELRESFLKSNIKVWVRHLFSKDSSQVRNWIKLLKRGYNFKELAKAAFKDSILQNNGGDLGWLPLYELDEGLASGVAQLGLNETSDIIQSNWGYHVVQLLGREDEMLIREEDYQNRREGLLKQIKQKKSQDASHIFISGFMKNSNPQPVSKTLQLFWQSIAKSEAEAWKLDHSILLTNQLIGELESLPADMLAQPLIKFSNGYVTFGQYLDAQRQVPITARPRFRSIVQLSNKMAIWMRDKMLLEEAYRFRLDKRTTVINESREFTEKQAYLYYLQGELENIKVPENIEDHFNKKTMLNEPFLQKFHNLQEYVWWMAEKRLNKALKEIEVQIEIDTTLLRKEAKTINWDRRIRMFVIPRTN
jgi:parvulin-like peptidyl-prolyl isomerase